MDVAQVIRLNRADMVAQATAQAQRARCNGEQRFHGPGEGEVAGESELGAAGKPVNESPGSSLAGGSGAVVVSGMSEAGGGRAPSLSGGGSGDLLFAEVVAGAASAFAVSLFSLFSPFCGAPGFFCAV
jgi:hypothetical protein